MGNKNKLTAFEMIEDSDNTSGDVLKKSLKTLDIIN